MNVNSIGAWTTLGVSGALGYSVTLLLAMQGAGCSGKLDLGSIPEPDASRPAAHDAALAPPASSADAPTGFFIGGGNDSGYPPDEIVDASVVPFSEASAPDTAVLQALPPAAPGLAGFGFVVNNVVQQPMTCPSDAWEFQTSGAPVASCDAQAKPACSGAGSAYLVNTSQFPVAYIAAAWWNASGYVPGVLTGDPYQLAGVLDPGASVDITSVYLGGTVALLGSSAPFSSPDAGKYVNDEGSIPWPAGVAGSEGATTMWLAQIDIRDSCGIVMKWW